MNFEFYPAKNESNRAKHGISLDDARALWTVPGVEVDLGIVNGEYRFARLALLRGVVHLAVFTFRAGPSVRLISARIATPKETEVYEQNRKR